MLSGYKTHYDPGKFWLKDRVTFVAYNIVYKPDGSFDHYVIDYSSVSGLQSRQFKSLEGLVNAFISAASAASQ